MEFTSVKYVNSTDNKILLEEDYKEHPRIKDVVTINNKKYTIIRVSMIDSTLKVMLKPRN